MKHDTIVSSKYKKYKVRKRQSCGLIAAIFFELIKSMKDEYELNDGHILEAIDRIHVATVYLQNALSEHALLESVDVFQAQIDKSIEILSDLYQTIGGFESIAELSRTYTLREGY
jgi:hypothetical protein